MKIKKNTSWKAVPLIDQFNGPVPDDFLGIEELTDYQLVKRPKGRKGAKVKVVEGKAEGAKGKVVEGKNKEAKVKKNMKKKCVTAHAKPDQEADGEAAAPETEENGKKPKQKEAQKRKAEEPEEPKAAKEAKLKKKKKKNNKKTALRVGQEVAAKTEENEKKMKKNEAEKKKAAEPEKSKENDVSVDESAEEEIDEGSELEFEETWEAAEESEDEEPSKPDENFEVTPDMMIWKAMYLPDCMVRAVWEQGFKNPTAIQLAVLPTAMKGRKDVVGAAETGSGKTLAFGIPILAGILKDKEFEERRANKQQVDVDESAENDDQEEKEETEEKEEEEEVEEVEEEEGERLQGVEEDLEHVDGIGLVRVVDDIKPAAAAAGSAKKLRALIVTPTRELAVQIEKHLKAVARYTGISMALVIGGMAAPKQERLLNKGPDVVIGTPGRLWELMSGGNRHLAQIGDIRYLALDETDRLLERGHFGELRTLLEHVNRDEAKRRYRQNFVFSATLTLGHEAPARLKTARRPRKNRDAAAVKLESLLGLVGIRPKAKVVDLTEAAKQLKPATLTEMKCLSPTLEDKDVYLYYFLRQNPGRTLVFCNSISNVRRLTSVFTLLLKEKPLALHAQMQQKQRLKSLERFGRDDGALLVATDVAARGLDIPNVQHVVHFQVPRTSENYVHRSGRTARAMRDGTSLMLVEPAEQRLYRQLCATLHKLKTDLPDYDVEHAALDVCRQRVHLARRIETLEHRMKRDTSQHNWVQKMAEDADLVVDDDRAPLDEDERGVERCERAQLLQQLKLERRRLEQLSLRPLRRFPKPV